MTGKEALGNLRFYVSMSQDLNYKETNDLCDIVEKELKVLGLIESKTRLLYKDRKAIAREFDKWCEENNAENCSENMATWFLSIKLKEWLEDGEED